MRDNSDVVLSVVAIIFVIVILFSILIPICCGDTALDANDSQTDQIEEKN